MQGDTRRWPPLFPFIAAGVEGVPRGDAPGLTGGDGLSGEELPELGSHDGSLLLVLLLLLLLLLLVSSCVSVCQWVCPALSYT